MAKEAKKKNIHEIEVEIKGEEWAKAQDVAFEKRVQEVKVDGFRKGKCPRNIFEKKFGKESLYFDAADSLVSTAYNKAISKRALDNTIYSISVYDDEMIIGYGRIIGDSICFIYIHDIMVIPEYQRKGIATMIMQNLLEK